MKREERDKKKSFLGGKGKKQNDGGVEVHGGG